MLLGHDNLKNKYLNGHMLPPRTVGHRRKYSFSPGQFFIVSGDLVSGLADLQI